MYVSNVIDELADELASETEAVADHLRRSIRQADRASSVSLMRSFNPASLGAAPTPIAVPTLDGRTYLSFFKRRGWKSLSSEARATRLKGSPRYEADAGVFNSKWAAAIVKREREIADYASRYSAKEAEVRRANAKLVPMEAAAMAGETRARWQIFEARFNFFIRRIPPIFGAHAMTYSAESKRVVIEFDTPRSSVIPMNKSVRFLKTTGEHRYAPRPEAEIKRMYTAFVAQAVLGVVNAAFVLSGELVETVGVNAIVEAPDAATGVMARIPILSVVASREVFSKIQLADVDPIVCLRHLSAVVSRSPAEVVPVRPIIRLDKSDPRFVDHSDVLAALDSRPNLMELMPNEFEGLVQNGPDPVEWTPHKRECSLWQDHVGSSLLSTKMRP